MIQTIKQKNLWFTFSGLLVSVSIVAFAFWGLKLGIDFTGGSLMELRFPTTRPDNNQITESLSSLELGEVIVQPTGEQNVILRFATIDETKHQQVLQTLVEKLSDLNNPAEAIFQEQRFDSIGPTIGQELRNKTIWAIGIVLCAIIAYVAWAFRKVSKPVASWKYGVIAVITLFHDVMITVGVFSILGHLYGTEVNATFAASLLTILGYSVNDTIVIFDRIRENLIRRVGEAFEDTVQFSLNQVMTRSINTSLTVIMTLFAILLLGGSTLRLFALSLIVGLSVGAYSSIFLASPLLIVAQKLQTKR